jgi:class 3 adenylate cyclase/GTPase SAR1 family protein
MRGHSNVVLSVSWSPDGKRIASASGDKTIRLWDGDTGEAITTLQGHRGSVNSVSWSPDGKRIASASGDKTIRLWDGDTGESIATLQGHSDPVNSVSWSPDGKRIASASDDKTICLWDGDTGESIATLQGHSGSVNSVSWSPEGQWLLSSSSIETLLWRIAPDGAELAGELPGYLGAVFAPKGLFIAALRGPVDSMSITAPLWLTLDANELKGAPRLSELYNSAKVVLMGDTGVGKTGLSMVLMGQEFAASESTHGRKVHRLHEESVIYQSEEETFEEKREVFLWDLAGQPSYRLVHQLHLHEVAVALLVFDARDEKDPLGPVHYWNRALEQSRRWNVGNNAPFVKVLVSARTDRGIVKVSLERIERLRREHNFDYYFETSAKTGLNIAALRDAVLASIKWPQATVKPIVFERIQEFLKKRIASGLVLATSDELLMSLQENWTAGGEALPPLFEEKFSACINLLEIRGLMRRFHYGDLLLLQAEYLDAYSSAIIEAAKSDPDGFGDLLISDIYSGQFAMPDEERLQNRTLEKLLLPAVVRDFLTHDLAIEDGELLVFPSHVTQERPDCPEPSGLAVVFTFEGAPQNIYATLAVRLARSGSFKRKDLWNNAATYEAEMGGECGIFCKHIQPGRAELCLFFDSQAAEHTRFNFEQFVARHLEKHAIPDSIKRRRIFECGHCGEPVPDSTAQNKRARGKSSVECSNCDKIVSLFDGIERIADRTAKTQETIDKAVDKMNETADEEKTLSAISASVQGETQSARFKAWAGDDFAHLSIVFTDIVGSTDLGKAKGDYVMSQLQQKHFAHVRRLAEKQNGYPIETAGDAFLLMFKSTPAALEFALALRHDAGDPELSARAAIHCGQVMAREHDAFGSEINYAHRVIEQAKRAELWISNDAYRALQSAGLPHQIALRWEKQERELKGFGEKETVWQLFEA